MLLHYITRKSIESSQAHEQGTRLARTMQYTKVSSAEERCLNKQGISRMVVKRHHKKSETVYAWNPGINIGKDCDESME